MNSHGRRYWGAPQRLGLIVGVCALGLAATPGCSDSNDGNASMGGVGGVQSPKGGTGSATGGSAGRTAGGSTSAGAGGNSQAGEESGGAGGEQDDGELHVGDRRIPYTPANDAEFAAFFAEHHQMAIDMAMMEIAQGKDADTIALATSIRDTQTAELAILEAAKTALGTVVAPAAADPHTEADMAMMQTMSGAELDQMFLVDMIAHHAAGLAPAERAQENLLRPELQQLARDIFSAQAAEIGAMKSLLTTMGVDDPGQDFAADSPARADFGLTGDRRIPLTPSDLTFIDFFVPHHQMAIQMAELAMVNGSAPIKQMATMMRDSQQAEVDTMLAVRVEIAGSAAVPPPPHDPMMMAHMEHMQHLSGAALDQMFLEQMIPHHAAGIPTAHRANPHLERAELKKLAGDIFNAQAREVGEMETMLRAR